MKKEKWEIATEKFLKDWKENPEVSGIIICGSYITGNPTKNSDVDIHIVLKKGTTWRERGNKIVDGILIEYFANPPEQIRKYLENDFNARKRIDAHMFTTGKVVLDKEGKIKELKKIAKEYLKKDFEKISPFKTEFIKYHLFDMADNLEEVYLRKTPDFDFVYHNFLKKAFDSYCSFLQYTEIPEHKNFRFLTNELDKKKYLLENFPDKLFVSKYISAIKEKNKKKMLLNFKKIVEHIQNKMGGFNIDGWKIKSKAE